MVRMLLNAGNCGFDCRSGQTKDRWDLLLLCKACSIKEEEQNLVGQGLPVDCCFSKLEL